MFFLTALRVAYILNPDLPDILLPKKGEPDEVKKQRMKCKEDEIICREHILNTLSDSYHDMFKGVKNPKDIGTAIERQYSTQK